MTEPDSYTKDKIERLCEDLLRRGAIDLGTFPTPLAPLEPALELGPTIDLADLINSKPSKRDRMRSVTSKISKLGKSAKRIMGATFFGSQLVVVDFSLPKVRARWTQSHEFGHVLIPWHRNIAYLDDQERLSPDTHRQREREAHLVAEHLLYQGDRAMDIVLDGKHGLKDALRLAELTQTSIHASLRHYVEHHPKAVALILLGQYERQAGLPIFNTYASPKFTTKFGSPLDYLPATSIDKPVVSREPSWAREIITASRTQHVPRTELTLTAPTGKQRHFYADSFYNNRSYFVMLTAKTRRIARSVELQLAAS